MRNLLQRGSVVLGLWAVTAALSYWGLGGRLAETVEGIDPAMMPVWPLVLMVGTLLLALIASVLWAHGRQTSDPTDAPSGRRQFLRGGAAVAGGIIGTAGATVGRVSGWATVTGPALRAQTEQTAPTPRPEWVGAKIESYRPLGNTGLMVSDISAGSTRLHQNADPVGFLNTLLDRGVNYIDASPDYAPQSEAIIKEAIAHRDRSQLVIASKFCTSHGHVRQGSSVQSYIDSVNGALERLGTDYLDVAHIHSCDTVDRLMDDNLHEAFDRLKEQGKARFLGVSTHTPNLDEVANTAIDSDRFQVMMLAYHHGAWPAQMDIIARAAKKGIGIIAMKTLKGAKHQGLAEFREERDSYTQAAFKWVLTNPNVSNLVISFFDDQHADEYLFASGQELTTDDLAVLNKYDQLIAGTHCFQHCGTCLSTCPSDVAIHDVLRYRMYSEDYGDTAQARAYYAKMERDAAACMTCDAPCAGACPSGVPIRERMLGAHQMLS